ncbi:MAG: PKD domain-containing protein [Methanomicrobiales archaeon]|nr:PKD domain-containing protein [Methanomicrobiales archaeon]
MIICGCILFCTGLIVPSLAASSNLLINPGFEEGTSGWDGTSPFPYTLDSSTAADGVSSLRGDEADPKGLDRFYQDVTAIAVPGHQYVIRGWMRTQNVTPGGAIFGLDYVNADGWTMSGGYVMETSWISGTTPWTYYTSEPFTLPAMPPDATMLWFLCDFNNGAGTAWFDAMEFVDVTVPVANFSAYPVAGTAPLTVQFTDLSGGFPATWQWDFGDGDSTNATNQHPVHTFVIPAVYDITLTVINDGGSDMMVQSGLITVEGVSEGPVHNSNTSLSYTTIQAAVDSANPGDIILADSGMYVERVAIGKPLTLRGVDTGGGRPEIHATGGTGVTLSADGIVLDGFAILDTLYGVQINSMRNTVSNNLVVARPGVGMYGIRASGGGENQILDNEVSGYNVPTSTGYAIYLLAGSQDNIVQGNTATDSKRGILVWSSSGPAQVANTISRNTFSNNEWDGICLWNVAGNTVIENNVEGNGVGIRIWPSTGGNNLYLNNIEGNTINAIDESSGNVWENPVPQSYWYDDSQRTGVLGNYYGEYSGADTDNDGVGDTAHVINATAADPHPLMGPWSWQSSSIDYVPSLLPPNADLSANPVAGTAPLVVTFIDLSGGENIAAWNWSFGDGVWFNTTDLHLRNPEHIYADAGTFDVSLMVTNAAGSDTAERASLITVTGTNNPPVLDPIGPKSGLVGAEIAFTVSGSDPDAGSALSFDAQDMPEGAYFDSWYRWFTWTPVAGQAGVHTVNFTLTDIAGAGDFEQVIITVEPAEPGNSAPVLAEIGNRSVSPGSLLTLTIGAEDPDGDILSYYALDLPANATFVTETGVFTWTPVAGEEGTYEITFMVADAEREDEETITITVGELPAITPPVAAFSNSPVSGYAPLPVAFTDLSTGEPTTWNWSFGDGGTSAEPEPTHTFTSPGSYDVSLTVTHSTGANTSRVTGAVVVQQSSSSSGGGSSGGSGSHVMTESSSSDRPSLEELREGPAAPEAKPEIPAQPEEAAAIASVLHASHAIGISEGTAGERHVVVDRSTAVSEGYTVTTGEHTIVLEDERCAITISAEGIVEEGGRITGTLTGVLIEGTPVTAEISIGQVKAWFTVRLSDLPPDAAVTLSIIERPSPAAQEGFAAAAAAANMEIDRVAYTMRVDKVNLSSTGVATIWMTVPGQWVQDHGGSGGIRIFRIPDGGEPTVLATSFTGNDIGGNMIFTGDSPDGLSVFGLISVKVTAAAHEPDAAPTQVPWTRLSIAGGLITWMTQNTLTIAGLVTTIFIIVLAGYWQRRKRIDQLTGGEGGMTPPSDGFIDHLIEGDRGRAYASIIDVLNTIDAQVQDMDRALAQGQYGTTAEAAETVDRFFYSCQVAEERIKSAAHQGHITDRQVHDLNDQLSTAVQKMVRVAAQSPMVTQLLQQKYEGMV